jgi:DNA mismatch endonuclease (patch repair protein)
MVDHVTKARRSAMMSAVRGKHTAPEIIVRSAAHRMGLRFRLHGKLPGRPDLVLPKWRTVLFVNGCFWHSHSGCPKAGIPKSNVRFWKAKFRANADRDKRNYEQLAALGWRVVVLWQCEVRTPKDATKALQPHFRTRE